MNFLKTLGLMLSGAVVASFVLIYMEAEPFVTADIQINLHE